MKKLLLSITLLSSVAICNAQAVRWGNKTSSPGTDIEQAHGIATDSTGNSYIIGSYIDSLHLGSILLTSKAHSQDVFVAKVDTLGHYVWAKSFGGTGVDEGFGIAIDNSGNVFCTGGFTGHMFFSPTDSLVSVGGSDIWVAKLDNNGSLLFKTFDGTGTNDYGRSIAVNYANGNFAVVGDENNGVTYYVHKWNSAVSTLFIKQFNATTVTGTGVSFDNNDLLYTCGYYTGNMSMSPNTGMLNHGGTDGVVIVFTSTGTSYSYYNAYGDVNNDYCYGIKSEANGSTFYICGSFRAANYVIGYDNQSNQVVLSGSSSYNYPFIQKMTIGAGGNTVWANQYSSLNSSFNCVASDKWGNVFCGSPYLETYKYMSYGEYAWISAPTGSLQAVDFVNGIGTDRKGNAYCTGQFIGTKTFGDSVLAGGAGSYHSAYIEKISSAVITGPAHGIDYCVSTAHGDSITITVHPSQTYNAGNVFTVQLDNTGTWNFTTPITIGSTTATGNCVIHAFIPAGAYNNFLAFRVLTSNPASTMGDQTWVYGNDRPIAGFNEIPTTRCPNDAATELDVFDSNPNTGSFGTNFLWNPPAGNTSTSIFVSPTVTTNYIVTLTDVQTGCTQKDTFSMAVFNAPIVNAGLDHFVCHGLHDTLHAIGTNIQYYSWAPAINMNGYTTANPVITPTSTQTSTVTVTSPDGCTAADAVQVISAQTTANAGPASYNTCLGSSLPLTGTGTYTGTNHLHYAWTPTTGISNPSSANPTVTPSATTMYHLTTTDSIYGCQGKDSINIIVGPVVVSANDLTITCAGSGTLTATATGNYIGPLTYNWTPSAHLSAINTQSVTASPIVSTNYFVTVSTANGCSGSDSSIVTVNPASFSVGFTAVSQLLTTPPFIAQFSNTTPGISNYTFTWDFGDGTIVQSNNATMFHTYAYNGTYDVTLTAVSNTTGCTQVYFQGGYIYSTGGTSCNAVATATPLGAVSGCTGDTLWLTGNIGSGLSYQWNLNGVSISGATDTTYGATVSGNYSVTVNNGTCSVVSTQHLITFVAPPAAPTITPNGNINLCGGGSVFLTASAGYTSYHWNTGATTQNITATQSGVYTVSVAGSSSSCRATGTYTLNASVAAPTPICAVGVDSATSKNLVIWNPPLTTQIDSFIVYKEGIVAGQFNRIGAVWYHSFSTFLDLASNPAQQSERYELGIRDSCGVLSSLSAYHKTIHLTINQGVGSTWNLLWNNYEGFIFGTFNIYRGTTPTNMTLLTSLASTNFSYTDLSPPPGLVYYQIEAVNPNGCTPMARTYSYSSTRSNIVDDAGLITIGINALAITNDFTLYPNPTTDEISILFKQVNGISSKIIEIMDITGRIIISKQIIVNNGDIEKVNLSELSHGVYMVKIKDENSEVTERIVKTK